MKFTMVTFGVLLLAGLLSTYSVLADDGMTTWRGQYYTGGVMQQGTFAFTFTVFDNATAGTSCYETTTNVTTGVWGEWEVNFHDVNEPCDRADTDYWLEIAVDDIIQTPRRHIEIGKYIRSDANGTIEGNIRFTGEVYTDMQFVTDAIVNHTLTVYSDENSYFGGETIINNNSGDQAAATLYVQNDAGKLVSLAIASSNYAPLAPSTGGLIYSGPSAFMFGVTPGTLGWYWNTYNITPDGSGVDGNGISFNLEELMHLGTDGNLSLFGGSIDLNGGSLLNTDSITVTGDVCIDNGPCISAIGGNLFDQNLNTDSDVEFGTIMTTSVNADTVAVGGMEGLTDSTSFSVCRGGFAAGTCADSCVLDIRSGIIINCV